MSHVGQQRPIHLDQPSILIESSQPPPPPPPPLSEYFPRSPDSRSPQTFVIGEATAIRVLVKLYGWTWLQAGVLRRPGA
jgi:hypothetical protein